MRVLAISPLIPSPVLAATKPPEPPEAPLDPDQSQALVPRITPQTLALFRSEYEPSSLIERLQREEVLATRTPSESVRNFIQLLERWKVVGSKEAVELMEQQNDEFYLANQPPPKTRWLLLIRRLGAWMIGFFRRTKAHQDLESTQLAQAQDHTQTRHFYEALMYMRTNELIWKKKVSKWSVIKLFTDMSVEGLYQEAHRDGRPPPPPPPASSMPQEAWNRPNPRWAAFRALFDLASDWGNWRAVYAIQQLEQEGILNLPFKHYRLASISDSPLLIHHALRGVARAKDACHLLCQHSEEFRANFEKACREAGKIHLYRM